MKKIFLFLALALATAGAKAQTAKIGDVNGDGSVSIADVAATADIVLGKATAQEVISHESFVRDNKLTGNYKVLGTARTFVNGYEYVDLGLPSGTLWCTTNVGGYSVGLQGTPAADCAAAQTLLPTHWQLPTRDQLVELATHCTATADGAYLKVANGSDATKFILISISTCKLWSASSDAAYVLSETEATDVYIRPVTLGIPGSGNDNEIGQGDDDGRLE